MGLFGPSKKDLKAELEKIQSALTPEMKESIDLKNLIMEQKNELDIANTNLKNFRKNADIEINELKNTLNTLSKELEEKQKLLATINLELELEEVGIYKPVYEFATSEQYKDRLTIVREKQKNMVKNDMAVSYKDMVLDGSLEKGRKMVKDNVKQITRSFNNECDVLIDKAKYNNVESIKTKINRSYTSLNKMNEKMSISINHSYLKLKLDELNLAYEYALKKQEEKEMAKEERERLREEAKLQKEIEEARKSINKEKSHYSSALNKIDKLIEKDPNNADLLAKKEDLENQLEEIEKNLKDIDYREANKRAGYVYIISNIGSFGENVYKIGMTRRLEPLDRVNELGDASVPFNFDVHAMIFSDDAPSLENALHKAFEDKKINMINHRREFFRVSIEEIETVVKENYDKIVKFKKEAEAEQYRESLILSSKN